MIKFHCDGCGKEVTEENGVIKMKEVTLEFPDKKVSISVEVDCTSLKDFADAEHPVVCSTCLAERFKKWDDTVNEGN